MTTTTQQPTMTLIEATRAALDHALATDPTVFLLGEDIADREGGGVMKVTNGLSTAHGDERVRSTPISEQAIIGAAIGAAVGGMRPVAEIMLMNFITVCMDQLFNHAAKLRFMSGGQTGVPLTVRTATGAGGGFAAQHSDMLEAWLAHSPGLKVAMPSNPADAYGLLLSSIFDDDPCVIVEHTMLYFGGANGPAPESGHRVPLGRANVVRPGADLTLIGYGKPVIDCTFVADRLAKEGVSIEVIDLRTISPWDETTVLESVARTRRAVVVHEAVTRFGVGAEISSRIHEELFGTLAAPVGRVGSAFCPVPFSMPLEYEYLYSAERIEAAVRTALR
jgi:acetoin:2,6-dichlorophenolindophenol oxidoreductase subunit beta